MATGQIDLGGPLSMAAALRDGVALAWRRAAEMWTNSARPARYAI